MATLTSLRDRLLERAQKVIQSEEFQSAVAWAADRAAKVKANLIEAKHAFQEQLAVGSEDDLAHLKRKLDRLDQQLHPPTPSSES